MIQRQRTNATTLAAVVLLVAIVVTGLYLGFQTRRQFIEISTGWSEFSAEADRKGAAISSIRGYLGYGGIIHTFKNYVLRQDDVYHKQLLEQLEQFDRVTAGYLDLPISDAERAAVLAIVDTIDLYRSKIAIATLAAEEGWEIERTDAMVRVDDAAATAGLRDLEAIWQELRRQQSERLIASVERGRQLIRLGFVSMALLVVASLLLAFAFWTILQQMRGAMNRLSEELVARRRLERREQRLAEAVEQSPATIMITDTSGHIEYVNRHFEELSGWSRDEVIGQTPRILQSGDTDTAEYQKMRELLSNGEPWHGVLHNLKKDGGSYWVESTILPLLGPGGDAHSYLGIGENITERLHAREQMVRAQKIEAVGLLAGGVAHDFNSVLTSILGSAHLAGLDAPEGSDLAGEIEQIEIGARRAQMLVQQLLGFARRKAGSPVPTELRSAVRQALRLVRAATVPTTRIEFAEEGDPVWVEADPTHLHQIVMNLCGNAAEAIGGRTGCVKVSVDLSGGRSSGDGMTDPECVVLRVQDDGPGMPEDVRRRIFDAFFTTKPLGKGTGLGLAVVHGLVTDMGGTIEVQSAPDRGACFTIRLRPCPAPEAESIKVAEGMPYGTERLLIVDDEAEIAATLRRSLTRLGYHVEAFSSSPAALRIFRADPDRFDAVITDVIMPDLDGVALAGGLRQLRPSIPVIFLTGFTPKADTVTGPKPMIVAKPVDPVTLARRLRDHLDSG
ncbi:hybrid sensor histidine kinase/response regulator [Tropicimonas aquimaris]|uniref:histidine kinase n=1 Tax=Tropicimonas aquimaris TaxID=914152 RepID=A0ABW3IVY8_9RHOB